MQSGRNSSAREQEHSGFLLADTNHHETHDHHMVEENFLDEDFDDLPLDELDSVIFQEDAPPPRESWPGNSSAANNIESRNPNVSRSTTQKRDYLGCPVGGSGDLNTATSKPSSFPAASNAIHEPETAAFPDSTSIDEDMDGFFEEVELQNLQSENSVGPTCQPVQQRPYKGSEGITSGSSCGLDRKPTNSVSSRRSSFVLEGSGGPPEVQLPSLGSSESHKLCTKPCSPNDRIDPAVTLTSSPFTYLCLLEKMISSTHPEITEIHVKGFIVTLLGKMSSSNGVWSVTATISDGTGYLDVELSDQVLTNLLGFSVPEKGALKRDPARRAELEAGMRRCQEELVDMCCIMTIAVGHGGRKPVVTKADPVSERVLQELEQRVSERR